jgi:hypothetical protein
MDNISNSTLIVILLIVVAIAVVAWFLFQKRRTETLRARFGPEYDRAISQHGNASRAENELEKRARRVSKFKIVDLSVADRDRFHNAWQEDQAKFVDSPNGAVVDADRIVTEVMQARGYPMGNFEQLAEDVSVDHPTVVENYRAAHLIAVRNDRGEASTEGDGVLPGPARRPAGRQAGKYYRGETMNSETMEKNLTTADLLPGDHGGDGTAAIAAAAAHHESDGSMPLFAPAEGERFRSHWKEVQTAFVDEPRQAVEQADQLVAEAIQSLAKVFADERSKLEREWSRGDDKVSTEDLRLALRRYRAFFDRLLSV